MPRPSERSAAEAWTTRETTASLLIDVRQGEPQAIERLVRRYQEILQRWAHGQIPRKARGLVDTGDVVQSTLVRALDRVRSFTPCRAGAFLAYLRRILWNQIRDQARRGERQPETQGLSEELPAPDPSPLEQLIGGEVLRAYEKALAVLPRPMQKAVILRIELGRSHDEVARSVGAPSPDAARMLVARAMVRLAEGMRERR